MPWTWTIHPSAYLTTATLTAARFAGFEPSAGLIVTTAGSAGRGPVLLRSKAMALAIASRWGLPSQEPTRPAQYLHRFGEAACRPHPAEREPARWWSMAMSPTSCSASGSALLRSLPRPMASSTATCSTSCLASPHRDRSCLARHPCSPQYPCPFEQEAPFRSGCRADHYLASGSPFPAPVYPAGSPFPAASRLAAWPLLPAPAPSSSRTSRWC